MIVRMAKIVVVGPQDLLMETLALIHKLGIMQVDEDAEAAMVDDEAPFQPQLLDKKTVLQHQFYEKLTAQIDELLHLLPAPAEAIQDRPPSLAIDAIPALLPAHITEAKKWTEELNSLTTSIRELEEYGSFLLALGDFADDGKVHDDVEWIGAQVQSREEVAALQLLIEDRFEGKAVIESVTRDDGTRIAVITTEAELCGRVLDALQEKGIAVYQPPEGMRRQPYGEQKNLVAERLAEKRERLRVVQERQEAFRRQWQPEYLRIRNWIDSNLALIKVTTTVVKTRMCFFLYGWLAASDVHILERELDDKFEGKVIVEESEIAEQDFARIPTALHNPAYFEPFELFTRLLPMPPYSSFDLTPFIGIFFPIFFGMMLGDTGYGIILLVVAVVLVRRFHARKNIRDAGKILFISSLYTMVFGLLYGECFGTVGHLYLGMEPICFDRQSSIVPMLFFAIAAGVVHVILGLILGVIASLRRKLRKEAVFRLVNILFVLCLCGLAVSYFTPHMEDVREPLLLTVVVFTPVLLLAGGLMAPLELLKNVGNIISYARIMAVGLTSVLLAFVANYMAGEIGSIWVGILVALILHIFNLILGVFAPTIHSLRLHYVEFLSKFMESGGKKFTPLGGKQ